MLKYYVCFSSITIEMQGFFFYTVYCYIINMIEISWLKMLNVSYIDTAKGMWFEHVNVNDLPFQSKKQPTKKIISTQT